MTMPTVLVKDFATRTRKNLETIRELKDSDAEGEIYEVTQLINSLLGLLVFPRQEFMTAIPRTSLSDLEEAGWSIPTVVGSGPQVTDLNQLVSYLRHAISHFNLRFLDDGNNKIAGLEVWNENPPGNEIWRAQLTLDELENICKKFMDLVINDKY